MLFMSDMSHNLSISSAPFAMSNDPSREKEMTVETIYFYN